MLAALALSDQERDQIQIELSQLVRERAGEDEVATLENPINIGIGTK